MNCWEILGIESTSDSLVIMKAYQEKLSRLDIVNEQEQFQQLKAALDEALEKSRDEEDNQGIAQEEDETVDFDHFLANLNYFYSLEAWKKYFRSLEYSEESFQKAKSDVWELLVTENAYQYLSPEILDYLCQYFSWHHKTDFSENKEQQQIFIWMQRIPAFSFGICEKIGGKQRRDYLTARYQLYRIFNDRFLDIDLWQTKLTVCEQITQEDLDLEMLKVWYCLQFDFEAVKKQEERFKKLSEFDHRDDNEAYRFLIFCQRTANKKYQEINPHIQMKRHSVIPPKIFHLLFGHLCYQFGSYDLAYAHWNQIVNREIDYLSNSKAEMFSNLDFQGVKSFVHLAKNGQFVDQWGKYYGLLQKQRSIPKKNTGVKKSVMVVLVLFTIVGIGKIVLNELVDYGFFSPYRTVKRGAVSGGDEDAGDDYDYYDDYGYDNDDLWLDLQEDPDLSIRYYYYTHAPDIDEEEGKEFFNDYSTLSEEQKEAILDESNRKKYVIFEPDCVLYHNPQKDGTTLTLIRDGKGAPLVYLEEQDDKITKVYSIEENGDPATLAELGKKAERNPYSMAKYIADHYVLENSEADADKDELLKKNEKVYQEVLSLAKNKQMKYALEDGFFSIFKKDNGYSAIFEVYDYEKDAENKVVLELKFDKDYQLMEIRSIDEDQRLAKRWKNRYSNDKHEDVTLEFVTYLYGYGDSSEL